MKRSSATRVMGGRGCPVCGSGSRSQWLPPANCCATYGTCRGREGYGRVAGVGGSGTLSAWLGGQGLTVAGAATIRWHCPFPAQAAGSQYMHC